MSEIVLNAETRESSSKHAKVARRAGLIPGIFYARGEKNISIEVPLTSLHPLIYTSETHIIDLTLKDGTMKKCIMRDVQYDPVTDQPVHFDLQGLRENEKLTVEVPVVLTGGIPQGVRDGGMVQHMIHKVKISCLPKDIPGKIEINIGDLQINHFIHIRDLNLPNVTMLGNVDDAVVGVMPPAVVKEAEVVAATEEAAAEPEVIGKGKKTEEGEEGAEGTPGKGEAKAAAKPGAKPAAEPEAKPAGKEKKEKK